MINVTNSDGNAFLPKGNYLFKKEGFSQKISSEQTVFLLPNDMEELEEIVIHQPKKTRKRTIGSDYGTMLFIKGIEYITHIQSRKIEMNKQLYKVSFPTDIMESRTISGESHFKLTIYDSNQQQLCAEYITLPQDKFEFIISKDIKFPAEGLYIGIEFIGKTDENEIVCEFKPGFENNSKRTNYYKLSYLNEDKWKTWEEVMVDGNYFHTVYSKPPSGFVFNNVAFVFKIEVY